METKLVFDVDKYISDCVINAISEEALMMSMKWARQIDQLSKCELENMGYVIDLKWCKQVMLDA